MRHDDLIIFSRWIVAGVLMLTPLALGCSAKTDPEAATQPGVERPLAGEAPTVETPLDSASPDGLGQSNEPFRAGAPSDPDVAINPAAEPSDAAGTVEDAGSDEEVPRPRSLFRSIGRALQKGVTDAAGGTSVSPDDTADPPPAEPR